MHSTTLLTLLPFLGAALAQSQPFSAQGQVRAVSDTEGKDIGCLTPDGSFAVKESQCGNFWGTRSSDETKLVGAQGPCGVALGQNDITFACNAIFGQGGQDFLIKEYSAGATLAELSSGKSTWTKDTRDGVHSVNGTFVPVLEDRMGRQGVFFNFTWKATE
ncbi:MAG: hypothetical protein MMC23_009622 [Stictis urceolatum]|nr:hypothetical protein [Stictis urceolata]